MNFKRALEIRPAVWGFGSRLETVLLTSAASVSIIGVSDEALVAPALGDVVVRSTMGVLSTEHRRAADEARLDSRRVDGANLVASAVAVRSAFRRRCTAN